ncbi:HbrB-domain-containing protein [Auricularia subglabra TFB-10046 SS5]|nr:HbrB-domain-containing protein [Auricularia subglabra TFB-10046 SS5]
MATTRALSPQFADERATSPAPYDPNRKRSSSDSTPKPYTTSPQTTFAKRMQDKRPSPVTAVLPASRAHTRQESNNVLASASHSVLSIPASVAARAQISPSKASHSVRTYDSKLVSREMHRLGQMAHLAPGVNPQALAVSASASALSLPASSSAQSASATILSERDSWGSLHMHVLPLFNREALRLPIEDLNALVKLHVNDVVVKRPSRAIATLESDLKDLIGNGMLTLNSKLTGLDDHDILQGVITLWTIFWERILTYLEAVFLPFQTEPILLSLGKAPKQRTSSPSRKEGLSGSTLPTTGARIDVREITLRAFRDSIIFPIYPRLATRLNVAKDPFAEQPEYDRPRLQQMLLVLLSTANHSLGAGIQPEPSEAVIHHLLRLVRAPPPPTASPSGYASASTSTSTTHSPAMSTLAPPAATAAHLASSLRLARHPSFLSATAVRERRGRPSIDRGPYPEDDGSDDDYDDYDDGAPTPRNAPAFPYHQHHAERSERGLSFLKGIKSPEATLAPPQPYGLGLLGTGPHSHTPRPSIDSMDGTILDEDDLTEEAHGR